MQPEVASGVFGRWQAIPLYGRILIGVILGFSVGLLLGNRAAFLEIPGKLILQILGALAPPLILLAVIEALLQTEIPRRQGVQLFTLLVINTLVAIGIGLLVANLVQPGRWSHVDQPTSEVKAPTESIGAILLSNIPKSLFGPLGDGGKVISVIFLAIAGGLAMRQLGPDMPVVLRGVRIALRVLLIMLHWVLEFVPLAVFGTVASIIGVKGLGPFVALGWFVLAVLLALLLQMGYYLLRIRTGSWVRPLPLLRDMRDALVMAFSTASSTITMPVTYTCLREKVGLRERSASMGALVGANFNNDGTALYEAMSALFISQLIGQHLSMQEQLLVVLTSVVASVGAAGIPEAGLVTMTLVFSAVGLPTPYIAVLLTVDWFLDRCRTAINVMGDVSVSCLLDGYERKTPVTPPALETATVEIGGNESP